MCGALIMLSFAENVNVGGRFVDVAHRVIMADSVYIWE
jgi:hypothetical protein